MSFRFGHGDQSGEAQSPAGASKSQETLGEVWSVVSAKEPRKENDRHSAPLYQGKAKRRKREKAFKSQNPTADLT